MRHIPEAGAVCGNSARTDLRGGQGVSSVPTATKKCSNLPHSAGSQALLHHHISAGVGHAGQYIPQRQLLGAQACESLVVANFAALQLAQAGAAMATAAGTGPVATTHLQRHQQWLIGPGIDLQLIGFGAGG